uniref:TSA: Wollemia nobilis Ref_Wollemi_Transcript_25430_1131 transcribed RNA sequence n=1 Tax=Wollemia nobilis TaxID=56998 RepID=A0A0C9S4B4_9CONI
MMLRHSEFMARRLIHQMWLNPSIHNPPNFRRAVPNLGSSPCSLMRRRELVGVSQAHVRSSIPHADGLLEQLFTNLKANNKKNERLEQMRPPETQKINVEDARRFLRLFRLECFKARLQHVAEDCIRYEDLLRLCVDSVEHCSEEEAVTFARLLDESGHILISCRAVYLRPHKVVRALEEVMPLSIASKAADPSSEELAILEREKAEIDEEAEKRAKVELRSGLGFVALQTAVLMRLTFWELSWDVMEPVCFFLTSVYFMAGYAFFIRTSTNPTFEGFFKARIRAKQRQLMKKRNFDATRFRELQTSRSTYFNFHNEF